MTKCAFAVVVALASGVVLSKAHLFSSRTKSPSASGVDDKPRREIRVPRAAEALVLDGELTEPSWRATPVSRLLRQDGSEGRPYSEVRFLWSDDGFLHVGLYASDRNIISAGVERDGPVWRGDSFHLVFAKDGLEHSFDIGPTAHGAVLTDGERKGNAGWNYAWQSGARVALDMDEGTVDQPSDADEEWVIELDIPLASIGLEAKPDQQIDFKARRCDIGERGGFPLESPCPELHLKIRLGS